MKAKEFCSCGSPQSFPIPHTHDLTDREKQIIKALEDKAEVRYKAGMKEVVDWVNRHGMIERRDPTWQEQLRKWGIEER